MSKQAEIRDRYYCPENCRHMTHTDDEFQIPYCSKEDLIPMGLIFENDSSLPLCEFYEPLIEEKEDVPD